MSDAIKPIVSYMKKKQQSLQVLSGRLLKSTNLMRFAKVPSDSEDEIDLSSLE